MSLLNGRPLVYWTIRYALDSHLFSNIIFSSDCPIITAYASRIFQRRVPLRASSADADQQSANSLLLQYSDLLASESSSWLWYLQPTSPLRCKSDSETVLRLQTESSTETIVSLRHVPHEFSSQWQFKMDSKNNLTCIEDTLPARRQDLSPRYIRDGRFYVTKTASFLKTHSLIQPCAVGFVNADIPHVNIDEPKDLQYAKLCAEYLP